MDSQILFFSDVSVGLSPLPVIVANEGLGWDSLLKMVHNPGGDWNPGRGDNPNVSPSSTPKCPKNAPDRFFAY